MGDGTGCDPSTSDDTRLGGVTHQRVVLLSAETSTSWEPPEAQQGEGQSPAPEEEQPQAPGHAGAAQRQTRKGPGGSGGHQVEHEPGKCPCGKEGVWYPGLHWEECFQEDEEGAFSSLLSIGEATPEVLGPVFGSSVGERHGRDWRESNQGHEDDGQEHLSYEERRREEARGLLVVLNDNTAQAEPGEVHLNTRKTERP